jgi:hypothetical protein
MGVLLILRTLYSPAHFEGMFHEYPAIRHLVLMRTPHTGSSLDYLSLSEDLLKFHSLLYLNLYKSIEIDYRLPLPGISIRFPFVLSSSTYFMDTTVHPSSRVYLAWKPLLELPILMDVPRVDNVVRSGNTFMGRNPQMTFSI